MLKWALEGQGDLRRGSRGGSCKGGFTDGRVKQVPFVKLAFTPWKLCIFVAPNGFVGKLLNIYH